VEDGVEIACDRCGTVIDRGSSAWVELANDRPPIVAAPYLL